MCGIFGSIKLNGSKSSDEPIVVNGVNHLKHRGPDENGVFAREAICFGHARLSIIDLSSGRQPMISATKDGLITYNGEVYNYREIRRELERIGYTFRSNADTEVVLNAFLEWGTSCLQKLRGMFAFACADFEKNIVILARDRVGKKPLYYVIQKSTLYFSSELESLYRTVGPFKLDATALDDYLYWQYIPAPKTIYREVKSMLPGSFVTINLKNGEIQSGKYWDLKFNEDRSLSMREWVEKLDAAIRDAVRVRLVSDVPYGAFLSGGLDSSIVVGYMSDILKSPVRTFSIGFENADYSELQYAQAVADLCHTEHHTEVVKADSLSILPILAKHYGQPFGDSSAIPTFYVARMASRFVKMVLSGDGGDENFAGYNTYENIYRSKPSLFAMGWVNRALERIRPRATEDALSAHRQFYSHFLPEQRRELFNDKFKAVVNDDSPNLRALLKRQREPMISRLQYLDIMTYLPYDILTKVDIASMANSLEVRCPLLDHELMEVAATIPTDLKFKVENRSGRIVCDKKHILKKLALKRFPEELIDRPKMGFGVPIGAWFADELRPEVRRRLTESTHLPEFFSMPAIEGILERHSSSNDMSHKIWNLLFLDQWMQDHSDSLNA